MLRRWDRESSCNNECANGERWDKPGSTVADLACLLALNALIRFNWSPWVNSLSSFVFLLPLSLNAVNNFTGLSFESKFFSFFFSFMWFSNHLIQKEDHFATAKWWPRRPGVVESPPSCSMLSKCKPDFIISQLPLFFRITHLFRVSCLEHTFTCHSFSRYCWWWHVCSLM